MTSTLRTLRNFGILFLVLSTILLVARLGIGARFQSIPMPTDSQFYTSQFTLQSVDIMLLIISLTFTVLMVILLYVLVFLALKWAVQAVLNAPALKETKPLNKLFGLVAVAFFFSSLLTSIYAVAISLIMGLFSDLPSQISSVFRKGMACIERTNTLETPSIDSSCLSGVFVDLSTALRFAAENVLGDAGISQLNPVLIVSAIAVFAIVAMASARVRSDLKPNEQFWLVYGAVAFFSIYLTLSAILAVPLLSEDTSDPPRPAEDLRASLEPMIANARIVPTRYPGSQQSLRDVIPESVNGEQADESSATARQNRDFYGPWLSDLRGRAVSIEDSLNSLRSQQRQLHSGAGQTARNLLDAAVIAYESEIDVRRGKREANRHFVDLRNWFQAAVSKTNAGIGRCDDAVLAAEQRYTDSHLYLSSAIAQIPLDGTSELDFTLARLDEILTEVERASQEDAQSADLACDPNSHTASPPPTRRNYGSYLGVVGLSASWLLSTESMEVTLITGLIGFGLLGALVAQFVKSGGREEFDMARIATVVFSGFCAAIVVYVAAYGGLAIASMSGSDPNPYVVFGACLVGAVYSAEIWERAKGWFITREE